MTVHDQIFAELPAVVPFWADRALLSQLDSRLLAGRDGQSQQKAIDPTERYGSLAVIAIGGRLRKTARFDYWWGDRIGGATYPEIEAAVRWATHDAGIETIFLYIDSHGGEWPGLLETADAIYQASATKRVVAFVDDHALSAAYCLAAQASEVCCSRGSELGSLGVYCVLVDTSAADQKWGLKFIVVSSAELKGALARSEVTKGLIADCQRLIDEQTALFFATVVRGRAWSQEQLQRLADARTYFAAEALQLGLVDRIGNLNEVLSELMGAESSVDVPTTTEEDETTMSKVSDLLRLGRAGNETTSPEPAPGGAETGGLANAGPPATTAASLPAPGVPAADEVAGRLVANLRASARRTAEASVRSRLHGLGSQITPAMRRYVEPLALALEETELLSPSSPIRLADGSETSPVEALYAALGALPVNQAFTAGEIAGPDAGEAKALPALSAAGQPHLLDRGIDDARLAELQARYGFASGEEVGDGLDQ